MQRHANNASLASGDKLTMQIIYNYLLIRYPWVTLQTYRGCLVHEEEQIKGVYTEKSHDHFVLDAQLSKVSGDPEVLRKGVFTIGARLEAIKKSYDTQNSV